MFDGIKIKDLSISVDALLHNELLTFPLPVDEKSGDILNILRRAESQGLTFTLVPRRTSGYRVEIAGSIHRYHNNGHHNADDYTISNLVTTIDELVRLYGINPFTSQLNSVEFGVNVCLPFPVKAILDNLICYKNRPFVRDVKSRTSYYQCHTQRYVVKLYDKGGQFSLFDQILRIEIKVLKMRYFTQQGICIKTFFDLLNPDNYRRLGLLLLRTFDEILYDEPTININSLTPKERDLYFNGRNPRFWSIPDHTVGKAYDSSRQRLYRAEKSFRSLLDKHRQGLNYPAHTSVLIQETWQRLTMVTLDLLAAIDARRIEWQALLAC